MQVLPCQWFSSKVVALIWLVSRNYWSYAACACWDWLVFYEWLGVSRRVVPNLLWEADENTWEFDRICLHCPTFLTSMGRMLGRVMTDMTDVPWQFLYYLLFSLGFPSYCVSWHAVSLLPSQLWNKTHRTITGPIHRTLHGPLTRWCGAWYLASWQPGILCSQLPASPASAWKFENILWMFKYGCDWK